MAILQQRRDIAQEDIGKLNEDQKLLSNKDLLLKNFQEVIDNLEDCDEYIQQVIVSTSRTPRWLTPCDRTANSMATVSWAAPSTTASASSARTTWRCSSSSLPATSRMPS